MQSFCCETCCNNFIVAGWFMLTHLDTFRKIPTGEYRLPTYSGLQHLSRPRSAPPPPLFRAYDKQLEGKVVLSHNTEIQSHWFSHVCKWNCFFLFKKKTFEDIIHMMLFKNPPLATQWQLFCRKIVILPLMFEVTCFALETLVKQKAW